MLNNKGRGAVSDGADTNAKVAPTRQLSHDAKTLIIYFSRGGNTEEQALHAGLVVNADMYELVATRPYPANYSAAVQRATKERVAGAWPTLEMNDFPNLLQYDTVLLGHPIWAMTIANPMRSFLESSGELLTGKRVGSFSTNAGYGAGETQSVLHHLLPNATILDPYTVEDRLKDDMVAKFDRWLTKTQKD
jgi:flavodoxin